MICDPSFDQNGVRRPNGEPLGEIAVGIEGLSLLQSSAIVSRRRTIAIDTVFMKLFDIANCDIKRIGRFIEVVPVINQTGHGNSGANGKLERHLERNLREEG